LKYRNSISIYIRNWQLEVIYSNRRNITSPRARIRCITLSRSTFIFSFSSLLPAREMREVNSARHSPFTDPHGFRVYFLHLAYIRYAAISERQNLRCRCTGRADGDADDDGIVARVGGRPPFCSLCHVGGEATRTRVCERARCYGTSTHAGHRLGQVSDKARSRQVLRGLSVCDLVALARPFSRASDRGLVSPPFVPVI